MFRRGCTSCCEFETYTVYVFICRGPVVNTLFAIPTPRVFVFFGHCVFFLATFYRCCRPFQGGATTIMLRSLPSSTTTSSLMGLMGQSFLNLARKQATKHGMPAKIQFCLLFFSFCCVNVLFMSMGVDSELINLTEYT